MGVCNPKVSKGRSESPLVASADAKFPCVAAQMMQKSHITKEKGDCTQAVPQKKIPNYIDSLSSAMRFSTCSAFC